MENRKYQVFLIFLIILIIIVNYSFLDNLLTTAFDFKQEISVERVIDGDTVVVNNTSVRLLGINTPEKGEYFYENSKNFLEKLTLNKTIFIEKKGQDKYYRDLAYLFDANSETNINLELVKQGYANYYFPSGKDKYSEEFFKAWDNCISSQKNLCKKSLDVCANCIAVKSIENENLILENVCNFDCYLTDWEIKDEGRKKFIFENQILKSKQTLTLTPENFNKDYVWTKTGDTIFLRDSENSLVLWKRIYY